jgi:hypothetical protein
MGFNSKLKGLSIDDYRFLSIQRWGKCSSGLTVFRSSQHKLHRLNLQQSPISTISEIGGRLGVSYGTFQRTGREALEHAQHLEVYASAAQRQEEALACRLCYPHLPHIVTYDFFLFPKTKSQTRRCSFPGVLPAVEETLDQPLKFGRKILEATTNIDN